ncbi:MAG: heme-binding protein [Gammaproteobacteria bacterium]|nr:heme-binding protein [Gammaproteobacteria bacterium]
MASYEKRTITADSALVAVQGAVAKAKQLGFSMSIAICDESGIAKATLRMDGASDATLGIAQDKAYSSASLGAATHALWDLIKNDPPLQFGLPSVPRLITFGGGYPILEDGKPIGAIGVSGGHYSDDMEVARAGLAAIGAPVS